MRKGADIGMAIRFFLKSETHSEFSNFAKFRIALDGRLIARIRSDLRADVAAP